MGDLPRGSERVPMEDHPTYSIYEDHTALLEEGFPPAGKTPCSDGELHHSVDATHKQGRDVDSLETEVDISGSTSSGTKRGKGDDGNSHTVLQDVESKEPSTYERAGSLPLILPLGDLTLNYLPSFLCSISIHPTPRLISAMKGGREKSGKALLTENRRVKWDPDVYDPPVTSVDHSVKSDQQQRPRSRKKDKNQQKQKHKRKSRSGNRGAKKSGQTASVIPVRWSSPPDLMNQTSRRFQIRAPVERLPALEAAARVRSS